MSLQPTHRPKASNAQWQATITHRSANVERSSRQFHLIARIDLTSSSHPDAELLIGDYVSAAIQGRVINDVFVIPRQALHDGRYVWRITDNKLYKQVVTVRWADDQVALISDGLNKHDLLNITPVGPVISGTAVTVQLSEGSNQTKQTLITTGQAPLKPATTTEEQAP